MTERDDERRGGGPHGKWKDGGAEDLDDPRPHQRSVASP